MATGLRAAWRDLIRSPITTATASVQLRRLRLVLAGVWLVALGVATSLGKPPLSLVPILMWLGTAMLIASIGNPLGWAKSMFIDWLPLYVILVGYNIVWGLVDNLGVRPHVDPQLTFDTKLFGAHGPTAALQDWLWQGEVSGRDYVFWVIYLSHFFVTLAVCAALWMRSRSDFLACRRRVLATWFISLAVFAAYPTVPPWMAADQGHLPSMVRVIGEVMRDVSSGQVHQVLSDGGGKIPLENPVAAVPSMHAALPMLLLLFLWSRTPRLRALFVAYTGLMGFVLVYSGEHFVFDILAGWLAAVVVHLAICRIERRRSERRELAQLLESESPSPDQPILVGGQ